MTDGVIMRQDNMFLFCGFIFTGDPWSGLVFHKRLVEELHENEGKNDEQVKDSGKHDEHWEEPSTTFGKGYIPITKGRHGGKNPVERFNPRNVIDPSFLRHQVPKDIHINHNKKHQNGGEPEKTKNVFLFTLLLKRGGNRLDYFFH